MVVRITSSAARRSRTLFNEVSNVQIVVHKFVAVKSETNVVDEQRVEIELHVGCL